MAGAKQIINLQNIQLVTHNYHKNHLKIFNIYLLTLQQQYATMNTTTKQRKEVLKC